jgi:hypothetical protein
MPRIPSPLRGGRRFVRSCRRCWRATSAWSGVSIQSSPFPRKRPSRSRRTSLTMARRWSRCRTRRGELGCSMDGDALGRAGRSVDRGGGPERSGARRQGLRERCGVSLRGAPRLCAVGRATIPAPTACQHGGVDRKSAVVTRGNGGSARESKLKFGCQQHQASRALATIPGTSVCVSSPPVPPDPSESRRAWQRRANGFGSSNKHFILRPRHVRER